MTGGRVSRPRVAGYGIMFAGKGGTVPGASGAGLAQGRQKMKTSHVRKFAVVVVAAAVAGSAFAKATGSSGDIDSAERSLESADASPGASASDAVVRPDAGKWSPIGLPFVDVPAREGGCDIYGLDIGVCFPRMSTVAGVQLGLFGAVSSHCYGAKLGLWGTSALEDSAGLMAGGVFSIADDSFRGVMLAVIGNSSGEFTGVQIGAANVSSPRSFALQVGIMNSAMEAEGFLVQIGLYNTVERGGAAFVQIGLANTAERVRNTTTNIGKVKGLPLLRVHW